MSENNTILSHHNATTVATDSTTIGILYLVTSLPVIFSNGIVMVVVVTSRELHLPTVWNITFMALCDFCFGLYFLIFAVPSAFMNQFAYPEGFIKPVSCLGTLLYGQNVLNGVVATVDRYLSVCWPLRYSELMTAKRFIIAIVVTVAINVCRLCLMVVPNFNVHYIVDSGMLLLRFDSLVPVLASSGLPTISVFIIIGFLVKIAWEMMRSRRRVIPLTGQSSSHMFTVTISLSAGLFCLSYMPSCICVIWFLVSGQANVPKTVVTFALLCLLSNSLWNVVIYARVYKPFRDAFFRLFCKIYYRRRRQMEIGAIPRNNGLPTRRPENGDTMNIETCE